MLDISHLTASFSTAGRSLKYLVYFLSSVISDDVDGRKHIYDWVDNNWARIKIHLHTLNNSPFVSTNKTESFSLLGFLLQSVALKERINKIK